MNNNIVPSLKLIYKPLIMYYGEWKLLGGLKEAAIVKRKRNLYEEFLDKYYYKPLVVIFKDEEIVKSLKFAICSRLGVNGRELFFSKRVFLSSFISNVDEVLACGEDAYKEIKKYLRIRKDKFRDVDNNGTESKFYKEVKKEYKNCNTDMSFEEFVTFCRKKYTKLLTGYNAVLDLFDKPLNLDKFISCFDPDKLYLHTCFSILEHCKKCYESFGRLDYNVSIIDTYKLFIRSVRDEDSFYNTYIINNNVVYTVDDLFREYDRFILEVNGK